MAARAWDRAVAVAVASASATPAPAGPIRARSRGCRTRAAAVVVAAPGGRTAKVADVAGVADRTPITMAAPAFVVAAGTSNRFATLRRSITAKQLGQTVRLPYFFFFALNAATYFAGSSLNASRHPEQ